MPRTPIAQLRQGATIRQQPFLLRERTLSTTRGGSLLLQVVLADRSGTIAGVLFDAATGTAENLSVGHGVEVSGRVTEYKGQPQITIDRIMPTELVDLEDFLPVARRPLAEMETELLALIDGVRDPDLARLLETIFDAPTLETFCRCPAAKHYHHACVGGLIEHTLDVAHLVLTACGGYPGVNRDIALTAAILHDIGKMDAYDGVTFDLTTAGSLWGHLYLGASRIEQTIARLPEFQAETGLRLVHAILAHHGQLAHGSPVVPMTPEAVLLHGADKLDGDLRGALDHLDRTPEDGTGFTDYSQMLETRLYRGYPSGSATEEQPSLW